MSPNGPKQVIVVVGTNKIVDTVEDAVNRARQIAVRWMQKGLIKHAMCKNLVNALIANTNNVSVMTSF
ncbi:MAG: LUD domain-containing protein [Oscillospiraceae bacterium]